MQQKIIIFVRYIKTREGGVIMYFYYLFYCLYSGIFAMLRREPRTLWIGLVFLLWVGSVFAFLGILSETYEIKILLTSIVVIIIIIIVGFPLYLLSFIFILIKSGYKLIKKRVLV